ncbi:MAG TPA: 3-deoxy-D-manno-octulosonic acid transferase [Rhodobacteraceae bacterium]|nr:3-deoxy-D-manno-octulosonic acid transferase [Paracoccaceae bacterium]
MFSDTVELRPDRRMINRSGSPLASLLPSRKARVPARVAPRENEGAGAAEHPGPLHTPRPEGPLVWLHVGSEIEALGIPDLIDRLREERDDLAFLVTVARRGPDELLASRLPRDADVQRAPGATVHAVTTFLDLWKPDVCIWADNALEPVLINATGKVGIPLFLVDARAPERTGWRWFPGQRRALLRRFSFIIASDAQSADSLQALGAPADRIEVMGFLQVGSAPLPCSDAERDNLALVLAARPVWFAAGATEAEVPMVIEAHRQAIRRAHRLLLILQPENLSEGPAMAERLEADGWATGLRSRDDDPEPEVEIFVADQPEELGLWYRLSPIALMGGSLAGENPRAVQNPFEAAALGSAVLFGPHVGPWALSYERLRGAGAARSVSDRESLARAVEFLLAPDMVAAMAAAAWELTTAGAEATDRIVMLTMDALDTRGV